mmetsp:Transcript_110306/g.216260  ORF Transcript_110306/g.216260 Transcript_110306/m.216260 type:complete len:216 (-) Transcript_110306:76-723(-)
MFETAWHGTRFRLALVGVPVVRRVEGVPRVVKMLMAAVAGGVELDREVAHEQQPLVRLLLLRELTGFHIAQVLGAVVHQVEHGHCLLRGKGLVDEALDVVPHVGGVRDYLLLAGRRRSMAIAVRRGLGARLIVVALDAEAYLGRLLLDPLNVGLEVRLAHHVPQIPRRLAKTHCLGEAHTIQDWPEDDEHQAPCVGRRIHVDDQPQKGYGHAGDL